MRVLKTADLGTQALLILNSFKLHLTAFNDFYLLIYDITYKLLLVRALFQLG